MYPRWEPTLTPSSEFASSSELLPKAEGQSLAQGDIGLGMGSTSSTADAGDTGLGIFGFARQGLSAGIYVPLFSYVLSRFRFLFIIYHCPHCCCWQSRRGEIVGNFKRGSRYLLKITKTAWPQ